MEQCIIYKTLEGGVAVIYPWLGSGLTIEQIAAKDVPSPTEVWDVPTGVFEIDSDTGESYEIMGSRIHTYSYRIVNVSDIPTDRSQRNMWTVNDSDLIDGVGV